MVAALIALVTIVNAGKLHHTKEFYKTLTSDTIPAAKKDTLVPRKTKPVPPSSKLISATVTDTLPITDTSGKEQVEIKSAADTGIILQKQQVDTFDIKISKDTLSAPVYYHADDSVVVDVPNNKIMLYGKMTNTKYEDNDLTAPGIVFDQKNNIVSAFYKKDSTGKVIAYPTFKQGELMTQSDSIRFNMKTGKGLTKGTYTQQGEMYVYGERIKKIDDNVFFAYHSRITTCNLDTPHFAFISKKIKFINDKFAVTGPVHPEFEGVPIPIYLPFGLYPMYNGRHSGLMAPSFTTTDQFGLALQNLGYYKVINDKWDVTTRATLYSYGGWTLNVSPRYYNRYHYQGNLTLDIQHTKILNTVADPEYSVTNSFKIRWTHSADTKSRPGVTFGANVEAGSTKFNQNVVGNPNLNYRNILTSSINYSKVWKDKPFNMSVSANHEQNTNLGSYTVTLPTFNFNMNTIYPFRKKEAVGTLKWYENIGIALNTQASNRTTFNDSDSIAAVKPVGKQVIDNMLWGVRHSVPISLSLPTLGPLQVSPGVSYTETWYQQKSIVSWNDSLSKTDTSISKGFYTARDMGFSLGMSSRIFGMFTFGKKSNIKAIRHEIRPQLSVNYKPDMNKSSYYTTQTDSTGRTTDYSYYAINNVNSAYSRGRFAGLSFGVDNNLQMKVKDKKDTSADATKKVTLIDGFSINGSYNFLAEKFKLSYFSMSARSNLFNKINISASATINPYLYDSTGRDIDRLVWKEKTLTLGRITGGNVSLSTSFQGGEKDKKQTTDQLKRGVNPMTGLPLTEDQEEAAYISNNPAEYTDFSIPWSVQFGYALRFSQIFNTTTKGFKTKFNSDINLSGSLALTEKWQLGLSTFYNFTDGQVGMVSLSIAREMHCWQMAISISPVGRNKFFSINISPKSALLRDIKVNRSKYFFEE